MNFPNPGPNFLEGKSKVKNQKSKIEIWKLNVKLVAWLVTLAHASSWTYLAVDVCILLEWSCNKFLSLMRIIHMCSLKMTLPFQ